VLCGVSGSTHSRASRKPGVLARIRVAPLRGPAFSTDPEQGFFAGRRLLPGACMAPNNTDRL